jgi:hypothetical protein
MVIKKTKVERPRNAKRLVPVPQGTLGKLVEKFKAKLK